MRATVKDAALLHDDDLICFQNRRKAVCDGDDRFAGGEVVNGLLNDFFALRVERGGGFIQQQDRRITQNGTGDGDALLLTAGEIAPAFTGDGIVAIADLLDEFMGMRFFGSGDDFRLGGIKAAIADVFTDGVVKQEGVLTDDANVGAQRILRAGADVFSIQQDRASVRIVKAQQEGEERALARTAAADEGVEFAGIKLQVDVFDRWCVFLDVVSVTVKKGDVFKGLVLTKTPKIFSLIWYKTEINSIFESETNTRI